MNDNQAPIGKASTRYLLDGGKQLHPLDARKRITKLQLAVAAAIDSYDHVTCADVAERAADQLGYEPSPTHVSRVLKDWGWSKTTIGGRVGFVRPSAPLWEAGR